MAAIFIAPCGSGTKYDPGNKVTKFLREQSLKEGGSLYTGGVKVSEGRHFPSIVNTTFAWRRW